jgi:hypothetical protein
MGHQRLGRLPRSRKWQDVVDLIRRGGDASELAAATCRAAEQSMMDAAKDAAVQHAFYLLARIPLAAREENFAPALRTLGLEVSEKPLLAEIVGMAMEAIDAQLSAAEALHAVVGRELPSLFGIDSADTKRALAGFTSVKQFSVLARDFFARLTWRHLAYYLSRELPKHVGPGARFPSVREHRAFEEALELHCRETTRIIQEYSGEWLSKHNFEGGIDQRKAGHFVAYGSKKIRDELRNRREQPRAT